MIDRPARQPEIQGGLKKKKDKEGIEKAILDRIQDDDKREWMDSVHTRRLIT